jgi:CO/xanthine dehydrogenase Mo-binding subunit/aerobic-type carbon monoxide dehydrogenase small subunit (CoxS/CutS family)
MNKPAEMQLSTIDFQVNGRACAVAVAPAKRLSDVLRDDLGLTGTKVGCSAGDCGACTVLLDDEQVCACLVPVAQVAERRVVTVEAHAQVDPILARLQRTFIDHGAAQCGICTPGMLLAAADTLRRIARPTEAQVLDGIGGVLCRCTGYRKIVEAVIAAAANSEGAGVSIAATDAGAAVGARVHRLDAHAKVSGSERYGADSMPADAIWLRVIRSPYAAAAFEFGDLAAFVTSHPGIAGVVTAADIPFNRFAIFPDLRDQPALAENRTRFLGEAVLVVAGSRESLLALDEREIPIAWRPTAAVLDTATALGADAPVVQERWEDNVLCRGRLVRGEVESAIGAASIRLQSELTTSYVEHAYIEPEAGHASWSQENGIERLTIFACTQTPYMDRDEIASMFELAPGQVRIIPSAVGGGFGGKLDISIQPLLAAAARKFGRAACIVYTRPESMVSTTKRHPATMHATLAASDAGELVAYDFHGDFNTGAYSSWGPTVANRVPIHASGPYRITSVRALTRAVLTNNAVGGAFRGFGVPQSTLINETLMDQLAEQLREDPLEFRLRNALRAGDKTPTGQALAASVGLQACLEALRPAWQEARLRHQVFNLTESETSVRAPESTDPHQRYTQRKRRGAGVACMWYGIGNTVIANPSAMQVGLRRDGRFTLYNGAVDIGQGTYTIIPQICADALGVPLALIDQVLADTDLTLDAGKSSASRQTFVSGNAARLAGADLRQKLLLLAGAGPEASLALGDGVLIARDANGEHRIDLATLMADERGDVAVGEGRFNPPTVPLDGDGQGVPYATYGFGAQFAEVEVDLDLGTVRILAVHAAHDVGRSVNPTQVEGQIHGGIAQGIGMALMEEYHAGRTDNLHDYLMPTAGDVPAIVVHLIEDPEPLGPFGAKGVGEPALIATAPAIFNAIYHACGVRPNHAPATPDRLRALLRAKERESK